MLMAVQTESHWICQPDLNALLHLGYDLGRKLLFKLWTNCGIEICQKQGTPAYLEKAIFIHKIGNLCPVQTAFSLHKIKMDTFLKGTQRISCCYGAG